MSSRTGETMACLAVLGVMLLVAATPALASSFSAETAWRAAAGATTLETFDGIAAGTQLSTFAPLGIRFDTLNDGTTFPSVRSRFNTGGSSHSGTQILLNDNDFALPGRGSIVFRPLTAGQAIFAVGYWNTGGDDTTTLRFFDANNVLIEEVTSGFGSVFNGIVSTVPAFRVEIAAAAGNGFFTIDDLQVRVRAGGRTVLFVADLNAGANSGGAIFQVDPATGSVVPIVQGPPLVDPSGIAVDASGNLIVSDRSAGVLRINPATGTITTVKSGAPLVTPSGVALDASGNIVVADLNAGSTSQFGAVFRINPTTGATTLLADNCCSFNAAGVTVDAAGNLFVADLGCCGTVGDGALARIDATTGAVTFITTSVRLLDPFGIAVEAGGNLVVTEATNPQSGPGAVYRINPSTGAVTTVASGLPLVDPLGVAIAASGDLFVADSGAQAIFRVNPTTGAVTTVASGPPFVTPAGMAVAVVISATADLAVTMTDTPDPVVVGKPLSYAATITNNGPNAATGVSLTDSLPSSVTFVSAVPSQGTCGAGPPVTCALGTIASGGSATVTIVVTPATPGALSNTVSVAASETDPDLTNNTATAATTVVGRPDLVVTALSFSPPTTAPGGLLVVTVTTQNQGIARAGGSTTRVYLSRDAIKDSSDTLIGGGALLVGLAAGEGVTRSLRMAVPHNVAAGSYTVIACADDLGSVVEEDEANNCRASVSVLQVTRPDLVVSEMSLAAPSVTRGRPVSVTTTVQNQGGAAAGLSMTRHYLSRVAVRDGTARLLMGNLRVKSLGPGASAVGTATVIIPTTVQAGSYFLLACADDSRRVAESDETNNCRASAISVR